jgi:hypothetical protein
MTDFWAFDRFFPLLNLEQLPSIARRPAENAMFKLRDRLGAWYTQQGKSAYKQMAPAMQCMVDVGGDREWTEGYIGGLILSELWALEANAPFSTSATRLPTCTFRRPEHVRAVLE